MSQEMSSKEEKEEEEEIIIKNEEDDKEEDEEFKMSDNLQNTCRNGPLEDLKNKINSSNINSRDEV